jgi:hypothetical protein
MMYKTYIIRRQIEMGLAVCVALSRQSKGAEGSFGRVMDFHSSTRRGYPGAESLKPLGSDADY